MYKNKETIKVLIKDLVSHPKNPKLHDDELIEKSIGSLGYAENVVVDENNVIISGHGRIKALEKAGMVEVEVIKISGWTEQEKEKYLLLANQSVVRGGFDNFKLKDFELDILNFSGFKMEDINAKIAEEEINDLTKENEIDFGKYTVLTVEAPEAPRLKARMSFYTKKKEDFDKLVEYFKKDGGELDVDKLLELLKK